MLEDHKKKIDAWRKYQQQQEAIIYGLAAVGIVTIIVLACMLAERI